MVFSSLVFLFVFLPLVLFFYFIAPRKFRNLVLLIFSLLFYAWGEPIYIFLMIFSSVVDYSHGILLVKFKNNKTRSRLVVASSVIINLSLLGFFKYGDFLIDNINMLFNLNIANLNLPLPIGISFYTFQTMSYTIDVYRGDAPAQKSPLALATYVTLFPQLIAGPIVRYQTIAEQINHRKETMAQFAEGVRRFIVGLGKKVLIANNVGLLWTTISENSLSELSVLTAWLGIIAYAFQIYFDFSGYSDMAIGLGKMFGFEFLENFKYPYISKSVTEFWRRWHISLGSWFRDYVYIPLGGNRKGKFKLYRNLFIVWFLTGLWHGASWNFVAWGLYFGLLITIEKAGFGKFLIKRPRWLQHLYMILIILIGWVLFVFEDIQQVGHYLGIMFGLSGQAFIDQDFIYYLYTNAILIVIALIGSTPLIRNISYKFKTSYETSVLYQSVVRNLLYLMIIVTSVAYLVDNVYNPFLYFRF